jgi:hypothetical protein
MSRFVDAVVGYRILRMLATPINRSDAFRLGIIDKDGDKIKEPVSSEELDAYSLLQRFIFKVQKALTRSSDRNAKRLLTFAAAMALLRENEEHLEDLEENEDFDVLLELYMSDEKVQQQAKLLETNTLSFKNFLTENDVEEENSVGGGAIAGLGVGDQGEPGRPTNKMPMFRRKKKRRGGNTKN